MTTNNYVLQKLFTILLKILILTQTNKHLFTVTSNVDRIISNVNKLGNKIPFKFTL